MVNALTTPVVLTIFDRRWTRGANRCENFRGSQFPLRHPKEKIVNAAADRYVQESLCEGITPRQRLYWKLRLPLPIWAVRKTQRWVGRIFDRR